MPPCRSLAGIEASHYDRDRGPVDVVRARAEGIDFFTHKITEGTSYVDPRAKSTLERAWAAGFPFLGAYHVLRQGRPLAQVAFLLDRCDALIPWARTHPGWFWQLDCESWQDGKIPAPTLADIHTAADELVRVTGRRVVVYAPKWVYGSRLADLRYPIWASSYVGGIGPFRQLYPGDTSPRWNRYSSETDPPVILQYSSKATIAGQPTCDANAFRGDLDDLARLLLPADAGPIKGSDDMLRDEQLMSAKISALQGLDDIASTLRLGHSGIGGPGDKHWINRVLEDIQAKVSALTAPVVTDQQIEALAARIADVLVRRPDTPLGPDDVPTIVAGVQEALRHGTGA